MAQSAIAVDGLETLQIALDLTTKITFDHDLLGGDCGDDGADLLGRELLGADIWVDIGLLKDPLGGLESDTINVNERGFDALVAGDFYAEESWHDRGSVWWMMA
jgi:hypothetical protein